jgi:hypothetical protein
MIRLRNIAPTMPTKVLLDHSIVTHASRMRWVNKPLDGPPGQFFANSLLGAERVAPFSNPAWETEAEAIFTVGTLIREKKVEAVSSMELKWEAIRDYLGSPPLDALHECDIGMVPNAIERGKFVGALLENFVKKGGKKDGVDGENRASQITFFKWLCKLDADAVAKILESRGRLNLTDFECESFGDLSWFKALSERLRSDENLPDAFHLWTAKRNRIDVFLTLDRKLINHAETIEKEKSGFRLGVKVRSPIRFLQEEGVAKPEPYPCLQGQFYTFLDIARMAAK